MTISTLTRRIAADRKGFGAMELGLALPFLMLLGLGMIDASQLIGAKIDYEQAAQRATDYALAKRPNRNSDANAIAAEAANAAGVATDKVTVQLFTECNGTKYSDYTKVCSTGQVSARFVSVNITAPVATEFDWSFFSRFLGIDGFDATVAVSGDSLVRIQ